MINYRLDSIMLLANQMISKIRDGSESCKGLRTGHVTYRLVGLCRYAMDRATPIPCRGISGEAETGKSVDQNTVASSASAARRFM